MKRQNIKKFSSGYMLVELIISISLLTIGFLGFFGLLSRSLSLNSVISDQFIANYLAMEGIEVTKNMIDANIINKRPWNQGFVDGCYELDNNTVDMASAAKVDCTALSQHPLQYDSSSQASFYGYGGGALTRFYRTVKIASNGNDEIKVNSIIAYSGRGSIAYKINLEDHFFNWRP